MGAWILFLVTIDVRVDFQKGGGFLAVEQWFKPIALDGGKGRLMRPGVAVSSIVVGIGLLHLNA